MKNSARIDSALTTRTRRRVGTVGRHQLPVCAATGLARYRDRHQARQGAQTLNTKSRANRVSTFACPDCRGFHLEKIYVRQSVDPITPIQPNQGLTTPLAPRKRRYVLFDVENPTHGAKATCTELGELWSTLTQQAPGITRHDHVVVGAARHVVHKYRAAIHGANVKWVVGADAPDGADHALLAAIDLRRVARDFDELVIISGDHAFANLARRAKALGLTVHVVTAEQEHRSTLSRELAAAADTHALVRLAPCTPTQDTRIPISRAASLPPRHTHPKPVAA